MAGRSLDHGGVHFADVLGVVGDRSPVERLGELDFDSSDFDLLTLGKAVGVSRHETGSADVGVQRISGVQVLLAEVGFLQRIVRDAGCLLRDGGVHGCRLGVLGSLVAGGCEEKDSASERYCCESNGSL